MSEYERLMKLIDGHLEILRPTCHTSYYQGMANIRWNEPIGIVLAKDKDEILVEYAMGSISNQLFVSKYQMYLPKAEELKAELERLIDEESVE